jgi:hypothetical protein
VPELLRPPTHRGPLIAAGGALLTLGLVITEFRMAERWGAGWHFVICALAAATFLAIALQWPTAGGRPLASQSVLIVCGLIMAAFALLRLGDMLGADTPLSSGLLSWTLPLFAALALAISGRKRSAIAALAGALALGGALLALWDVVFDPESVTPFRWLLLLLSIVYVLVSLVLRGGSPRHSEQMINGAGLAVLAIAATGLVQVLFGFFGAGALLPGLWELVVLAAGCGLVAFGAIDRAPGPAWLGVANLGAFLLAVTAGDDATLEWWPFTLLVLGGVAFFAGLRPRRPLPPEPDAYHAGDVPLAVRSDGETVVNVRHQ